MRRVDITGIRFGRLLAIARLGTKGRHSIWKCICDCGNTTTATLSNLRKRNTLSCGCLRKIVHTKHGMSRTSEYTIWEGMIQRCNNTRNKRYSDYGGRGIRVCLRWMDFKNFILDIGKRPKGMSIERINNDGDYEPSNCRWATSSEQQFNKRK